MSYATVLRDIDILEDLSQTQLENISALGEEKVYDGAEIIVKENTPCNELYIILNGIVEILVIQPPWGRCRKGL